MGDSGKKRWESNLFWTKVDARYSLDFKVTINKNDAATVLQVGDGIANEHGFVLPRASWDPYFQELVLLFLGPANDACTTTNYEWPLASCGRSYHRVELPLDLMREYRVQVEFAGGSLPLAGVKHHNLRTYLDGQLKDEVVVGFSGFSPEESIHGESFQVRAWPGVSEADQVGVLKDVVACVGGKHSPLHRCEDGWDRSGKGQRKAWDDELRVRKGRSLESTFERTRRMNVSMQVKLWEKGAFFQLGNSDTDEYPLLRYGGANKWSIAFESVLSGGHQVKEEDLPIVKKQWTQIDVVIDDQEVYVLVNGEVQRELTIDEELQTAAFGDGKKVWIAGKWNKDADGEIKKIRICNL